MTLFRGLFVRKDATRGTTPVEARKALAGLIAPAARGAFGVRPGILRGLVVSGTGAWTYSVAPGYAVTSRSSADGGVLFGNDAAATVATSAAPATGSRIDIVYVRHLDVDQGDATSDVVLGVAQGTASGTPTAPTIPTGALEIARATVAAGAASTSAAGVTITQTGALTALVGGDFWAPSAADLSRILSPNNGDRAWSDAENVHYVRSAGVWAQLLTQPGAWMPYTPTFSGITVGNGTIDASYQQIGKNVDVRILFTLGSTSAVTGSPSITLPVAAAKSARIARGTARPTGAGSNYLMHPYASASSGGLALAAIGTNGATITVSATVPATWAAGGWFLIEDRYEAA